MESDDSADIPLSVVQNRLASHSIHLGQPSDDEDDKPLSTQAPTFSRLKKRRDPNSSAVVDPESDSDDDVPLASTLKKSHKPSSRPPAPHRKPAQSKRESDTKSKAKKPVKRAPRVKKEEDAPIRKFEKLGQRRETPPENDPTRLFYQSMYHEKISLGKESRTADIWMLRNGLLDDRDAEKIMDRYELKR